MRPGVAPAAVPVSLPLLLPGADRSAAPLPDRMADTGGGTQPITAVAPGTGSTSGTVTWWDRKDDRWVAAGSAPARSGAKGLAEGAARRQGTATTPTGLYGMPYAFGIEAAPCGTAYAYRPVRRNSWWCQDDDSRSCNRWTEPRAADCRAAEAERLTGYRAQYAHALVVGFDHERPVRGRGAGILLHVNGREATAGWVSVPRTAMRKIPRWADPARRPHIAIGAEDGHTAITRC